VTRALTEAPRRPLNSVVRNDRTSDEQRILAGSLRMTGIVVHIDRGIIQGWLPRGLEFPKGPEAKRHPLHIMWGTQQDVAAYAVGGRIPFPWRLNYSEIITAVPDLRFRAPEGGAYHGPVTYLGRLYMNSWRAILIGRGLYGFGKAYARIEDGIDQYRAVDRRQRPLLSANIGRGADTSAQSWENVPRAQRPWLFPQPIALARSRRPRLARFEFDYADAAVRSVNVQVELYPALLSYLPHIRESIAGAVEEPGGAFQIGARWTLKRMGPLGGRAACRTRIDPRSRLR
jgi:hypothetical protein